MTRIQFAKPRAVRSILASAALLITVGLPVGASADSDQLRAVLELQSEIAGKLGITASQDRIEQTLDRLDDLSVEEADTLSEMDSELARLTPILQVLSQGLDETAALTAAGTAVALTPVPAGLSTPLTAPGYFDNFLCPPVGVRHADLTVLISEQALFVALAVKELASRGCDQTAFGANTSLACIVSDVLYLGFLEAHTLLTFCNATVDSAEIEGAFERTADIFANLNEHNANLSLHDANLDEHDANIDLDLATHDADIKALLDGLQGAVDENTQRLGDVIRLLHTPQGQRESDTPVCDGEPCDWNFPGS